MPAGRNFEQHEKEVEKDKDFWSMSGDVISRHHEYIDQDGTSRVKQHSPFLCKRRRSHEADASENRQCLRAHAERVLECRTCSSTLRGMDCEQHASKSRESSFQTDTHVLAVDPQKCRTLHELTRSGPRNGPFLRNKRRWRSQAGTRKRPDCKECSPKKLVHRRFAELKTCVVRSRPCIFADFLPLKET